MAYVEVRRLGELMTRRWVDDERARRGFGVQLGHLGSVHVALGEVVKFCMYEVRLVAGAPGEDEIPPPAEGPPEESPSAREAAQTPADEFAATDESAGQAPPSSDVRPSGAAPEPPPELPIDEYVAAGRLSRAKALRVLAGACRCVQRPGR